MDTWRKQALVSLESDLKVNLSLAGLLSRLERPAGGFMTEDERRSVEEVQGKSNQVGKIIEVLRGKGNRDFDAFLNVLRESGNELWAEKLDESARQFEEYHKAKEQSGLKAIEYHVDGGSDMAVQLPQGGQVHGEGGTRIVYVPVPVLQRKRSRSSASSGDTSCHPSVKRNLDEYLKMKMDLVKQDMKSVHAKCDRAIRLLYANALKRLVPLLKPHLNEVKDAAIIYLQAGLHEGEEYVKTCDVQSAKSISELLSRMSTKWNTTCFLEQAVDAIPAKAIEREVAEAILSHYNLHLAIYEKATLLKDDLAKKESQNGDENKQILGTTELVPLELTSFKSLAEFTCEDCHHLQVRFLSQVIGIPAEKIICLDAVERQSTTVTFLVPSGFTYIIMQRTTQLETVWILLELSIIEVAISGFTFKPTMGCFLTLLRGGKPFTADLLRVTEILPYQMHCLVDPGSKEPLSGQLLDTKRIAQHWKLHEESMSFTAVDEAVEPTPETGKFPPKVEDEGKELLPRVQRLEDELKGSKQNMIELINGNRALQYELKAIREEEGHIHQELASLKETLLPLLKSQTEQLTPLSQYSLFPRHLSQAALVSSHAVGASSISTSPEVNIKGEMGVLHSRSEATIIDRDPLSQPVHLCDRYAILLRKHVSRRAAGKGKSILEWLGLTSQEIKLCYQNNPLNEEEAIQDGLEKWRETHGDHCTWQAVIEAMKFAGIAQQHCSELVEELHQRMQGHK